mgnify:CR=1 FL=1
MKMKAKWGGPCKSCGKLIPIGAEIDWDPTTKKIFHVTCAPPELGAAADVPHGTNKYPAKCTTCGTALAPGTGKLKQDASNKWLVLCKDHVASFDVPDADSPLVAGASAPPPQPALLNDLPPHQYTAVHSKFVPPGAAPKPSKKGAATVKPPPTYTAAPLKKAPPKPNGPIVASTPGPDKVLTEMLVRIQKSPDLHVQGALAVPLVAGARVCLAPAQANNYLGALTHEDLVDGQVVAVVAVVEFGAGGVRAIVPAAHLLTVTAAGAVNTVEDELKKLKAHIEKAAELAAQEPF